MNKRTIQNKNKKKTKKHKKKKENNDNLENPTHIPGNTYKVSKKSRISCTVYWFVQSHKIPPQDFIDLFSVL